MPEEQFNHAGIAQSVEQLIRNQQVAGSSPVTSSSSSQASYRLRRAILLHKWLISRSFCCSSLPKRKRCAGLRFGFLYCPDGHIFFINTGHQKTQDKFDFTKLKKFFASSDTRMKRIGGNIFNSYN